MKFAYLILCHKNPSQLADLIDTLQDGSNYFFVHVDNKVDIVPFVKKKYFIPDHVFFCDERVKVSWGGFSQIEATMSLIKLLVKTGIKVDYVHLLSGQDFPLKNNSVIKDFFERHNGLNFINYFPMPYQNWSGNGGMDRLTYKWLIDESGYERACFLVEAQKQRGMTRIYPSGFDPYGGSQWWSLTDDCVRFIEQNCVSGAPLYDFYRNTYIPDEMFFQTVLVNSFFKKSLCNNNLRYIDWEKGPEYPRVLRFDDFPLLVSSLCLYARKFDDTIDMEVRTALKNKILI